MLLIGWDSADWEMIDPLLQSGQMPALAQLDFPMCADITVIPECSIFWPTGAPPHRGSPGLVAEIAR